jgi:transposase
MQHEERRWFAGIDWAFEMHHVFVSDDSGRKLGEKAFPHTGEGLIAMQDFIVALTGSSPESVFVAIEVPHGPVVESFMERGFRLHSINPKQLDRFRDRFSPAGAKDDSRDAEVLGSGLRTDPHCFRPLSPLDPVVVELREWSRIAEDLTKERGRLANRLRQQLWRYYPQMLELTDDIAVGWFLELWALLPTPDNAKRVRESTVTSLLKRHRIRRIDAGQVLATLRQPAIAVAAGTVEAATAHIKVLTKQLELVNRQINEAEQQVDRLTDRLAGSEAGEPGQKVEQRDVTILRSLPGVGRNVLASLLTEGTEPLQRRDYHSLRCLCGSAPVTKRSGKSKIVTRRLAVNHRLANALFHWARSAIQHDPTSRAKYDALRQRGHGHARALRSVGDRLLNVACSMLESQTVFDPNFAQQKAIHVI